MSDATTPEALADELMQVHNGHADEGPTTFSDAAATLRTLSAELAAARAQCDSLRAEVERLRTESVPLGAIRALAVEAIRDVTGCPDVTSNGKNLTDVMEATAKLATYAVLSAPPVAEGAQP